MRGALTLLELLAVLAIIALLIAGAVYYWGPSAGGTPSGALPVIPYPPPPTGATPGAAAAVGVAQGRFIDNVTSHRRQTSETYRFHRYDHHYLLVPSDRDKEGVVFKFYVSVVNAGDQAEITGTSTTTGSQVLTPASAAVATDAEGHAEITVYVPAGEFSTANVLRIMVEEIDATGTAIRRVFHSDVAIVPP